MTNKEKLERELKLLNEVREIVTATKEVTDNLTTHLNLERLDEILNDISLIVERDERLKAVDL